MLVLIGFPPMQRGGAVPDASVQVSNTGTGAAQQLIQLAPGVNQIAGNAFLSSGFQGRAPEYSIAGSRPIGQSILLDDENLQNF
jgi:hypothetical protein